MDLSKDKVLDIISDITGYDLEDFTMEDKLIENLGFDSIMIMDLYNVINKVPVDWNDDSLKELINVDITINQLLKMLDIEESASCYPVESCKIDSFMEVESFYNLMKSMEETTPYFRKSEGVAGNRIIIEGREKINFSTYNYLGLNGDMEINDYVKKVIDQYGTSVSGSRLLSGHIDLHEKLEKKLAGFLGTEDAVVQVGGHSTNVNTIGSIVGEADLVLHDALAHNSIIQGALLSQAKRKPFKHNDMIFLESELQKLRKKYRRVLIVVEGVYSMDGDICNLPELIRIKNKYGAILMVDEAHSFGTIGRNGRGVTSYYNIDAKQVDIMMGTLSKSAASCGGYIAGSSKFINYLRYNLPGFIFSCGSTPANTAAAFKAIELFDKRSANFLKLKDNSQYFLGKIKELGFNTGKSHDSPIIPIIIGNSKESLKLSSLFFDKGINVLPIIYPAVKEDESRLRFFISASHSKEDLDETLDIIRENFVLDIEELQDEI